MIPAGFVFFTNYDSDKGRHLAENPQIGLCFHWQPQHRQVRVTGVAGPCPASESDAYFTSRPREARLGAWASSQSAVIPDKQYLRPVGVGQGAFPQRCAAARPVGRLPGAVRSLEFWQGQP